MTEEPEETPPADRAPRRRPGPTSPPATSKRPVRRRSAPTQVTVVARSGRRPPALPRAWWLMAAVEVTLVAIVLVVWLTGLGDPPAGCSRSICSTGQGAGLLALVGAVAVGAGLVVSMFVIAVGAAQRQPGQARPPRQPRPR